MDIQRILASSPVNKQSGLVTSQAGCNDDINLVQERDDLIGSIKSLKIKIDSITGQYGAKAAKKELGVKMCAMAKKISKINRELGRVKKFSKDFQSTLVDTLRKRLSDKEWSECITEARELHSLSSQGRKNVGLMY